jgi:hypothetical protein
MYKVPDIPGTVQHYLQLILRKMGNITVFATNNQILTGMREPMPIKRKRF